MNPMSMLSSDRKEKVGWNAVSTASAVLGGIATRSLIKKLWTKLPSSEHEPPLNPADRRIGWSEALQWAIAAGVGVGIGRMVSQRVAAAGWEAATGSPPPGIEDD